MKVGREKRASERSARPVEAALEKLLREGFEGHEEYLGVTPE